MRLTGLESFWCLRDSREMGILLYPFTSGRFKSFWLGIDMLLFSLWYFTENKLVGFILKFYTLPLISVPLALMFMAKPRTPKANDLKCKPLTRPYALSKKEWNTWVLFSLFLLAFLHPDSFNLSFIRIYPSGLGDRYICFPSRLVNSKACCFQVISVA